MARVIKESLIEDSRDDRAALRHDRAGVTGYAEGFPEGACFHCGEPCPDRRYQAGSRIFCCQGCLIVHDLLAEAGLSHFYDLERHPGVRIQKANADPRWSYLDEPAVRERLLDFTDGRTCRVTFHIPAIHCVACVWLLENLFRLHPGIGASRVNFPRREAAITFSAERLSLAQLASLLASIGYEPQLTLQELEQRPVDPSRKRRWLQLGIAGFCFGNIMLFSIPGYLGLDSFSGPLFRALFGYLSLALALPVLCYSAADYWRSAWVSFRERALTLEIPIALGLAALYLQSGAEILSGRGEGYLDSLAGLVFFLLCGRAFQHKTFDRLAFDRDYKCFFPLSVTVKRGTGEQSVAISEIRAGDRLLLKSGELIPADCRLVEGEGLIDYSFVTGESSPVKRAAGDYLYAGGKQTGGAIETETIKPVSQSYLTSLWSEEAFRKERGNRLQSLTNRYSRRFTKVVVGVALAGGIGWAFVGDSARGLKAFTSVLIVACPCALALAAPFALGTAQRLLAKRRIFLRDSQVLEPLAQVDTVVFDKTGTLTSPTGTGSHELSPAGAPLSAEERMALASLARQSTHPYCVALCGVLSGTRAERVVDFLESAGLGIKGTVSGRQVIFGSAAWLEQCGYRLKEGALRGSRSFVGIDGLVRGEFLVANSIRPGLVGTIRELAGKYELALLSGDNDAERDAFVRLFGEKARIAFNQSPMDKLAWVRKLQDSGKIVMMVGDGLNDAGALKQSNVGVAVVENIGRFSPASDLILDGGTVGDLATVLEMARRAVRTVRLSFAVSALYNLCGISIAAAGVLSPLICAVLMPLSSVSVVLFACGSVTRAERKVFGSRQGPMAFRRESSAVAATLDPRLSTA